MAEASSSAFLLVYSNSTDAINKQHHTILTTVDVYTVPMAALFLRVQRFIVDAWHQPARTI